MSAFDAPDRRAFAAALALCMGAPSFIGCARAPASASKQKKLPAAVERLLQEARDRPSAPGLMLAVVKDDVLVADAILGSASLEHDAPVERDSLFDFGLLEERLVALAAFKLMSDSALSLDRPISQYLGRNARSPANVTMRHLLQHLSGLEDMAERPQLQPGLTWRRSIVGVRLAEEVIAKISGVSFAAFAQNNFIEPARAANARLNDPFEPVVGRVETYVAEGALWRRPTALTAAADGLLLSVNAAPGWRRIMARDDEFQTESGALGAAILRDGRALPFSGGLFVDRIAEMRLRWRKCELGRGAAIWIEAGEICVLCAVNAAPDKGFAARLALTAASAFSGTPALLDLPATADSRTDLTAAAAALIMGQGRAKTDPAIELDQAKHDVSALELIEHRLLSGGAMARWYRLIGPAGERSLARVMFDRQDRIFWLQTI